MTGILIGVSLLCGAAFGWVAVVMVCACSAVAMIARGSTARWMLILVPFALLGVVRVHDRPRPVVPEWLGGDFVGEVMVANGPVSAARSQSFELFVFDQGTGGKTRVCASGPLIPELGRGDRVWVKGDIARLDDLERGDAGFARSRSCSGVMSVEDMQIRQKGRGFRAELDQIRRILTTVLHRAVPGETGVLMAGLVTGDDAALSYQTSRAFKITGTSHVTAVSGANLSVIITLIAFVGGVFGRARSNLFRVSVVTALWGYVLIIGLSPPPLRAAVVATAALIALWIGRKPDFITLSLIAATIELLYRPADFDSLAFRLSTVSAVAIVLGISQRSPKEWYGWLVNMILGTIVTQAATSVLLIPIFGTIPIYAVPANVVIAPLTTVAFPIALVAGVVGLLNQTAGSAVAQLGAIPARGMLESVSWVSRWPFAERGDRIAALLPVWGWTLVSISIVLAISRECRGGIVRLVHEVVTLDRQAKSLVLLSGVSAAVVIGIGILFSPT